MKYRRLLTGVLFSIASFTTHAAVIFSAQDILPDGNSTLQAERDVWLSGLGELHTEGFEDAFVLSNQIDFEHFSVSITGSDFIDFGANVLTRTEGTTGLGFRRDAIITFEFLTNISAFAIDWSSIDFTSTNIDYSDSQANNFFNIAPQLGTATAGFFGITGINTSSISFDISSAETLEFDFIQFELASEVSAPPIAMILILAILGILSTRKVTLFK